jgi:hypothetical protein
MRPSGLHRSAPADGRLCTTAAIVLAAVVSLATIGTATAGELTDGTVLGPENWEAARDLLPVEFLECYKRGDFRHRIMERRLDVPGDDPVFREGLEANKGRYDVNAEGSIIDKQTGKPAASIYAWPFPTIDPADPNAAVKIVWNYFYAIYYGGNGHYRADLLMISRHGLDRAIEVDTHFKHYEGQHPRFRETVPGHEDLLTQMRSAVDSPADVAGTVSLAWRYRGKQRDGLWTYVPALRRVRQVSPANRSDGFLGSDMAQDDGPFFDGKIEDFTWKLVGEQDLLVLFDLPSFEQQAQLTRLPEGGWRMTVPAGARLGFQVPDWKGAPWCPMQEVLIRRPHWVIEAVPKDRYYLYGKIVLRFDKEFYLGSYSSKHDWKGALITSFAGVRTNFIKVGPGELWGWVGGAVATAISWMKDRATTAGILPGDGVPADSRIPLKADIFSRDNLSRTGR